jgi:DNA polymerase-3 subunit epsilon
MREIVLDTETTGFDPAAGHRIAEIGCVEMVNQVETGNTFQKYVNPERDMPEQAFAVHGLSEEFLSQKPLFAEVADEFLEFIGDATLIIHNAEFDVGFLNAELKRVERPPIDMSRVVDTVSMARKKFPGAQANLDALCRRFQIDNSDRDLHGALKDAQLLAGVYVELIGGQQHGLELAAGNIPSGEGDKIATTGATRPARTHAPSPEEELAHTAFLEKLDSPIWRQ